VSMRPLVTIGIPFLNPGVLLKEAIQSVFCQTLTDWELILVNDGSNDESVAIAQTVRDPRVRLINDGKTLGLVARLNQLGTLARGEYMARMDADDIMHPFRLEKQIRFLQLNRDISVVDTGAFVINQAREPIGIKGSQDKRPSMYEALKWGVILHPTVIARTSWYMQHPYDPAYPRAEDRELFVRVLDSVKIAHLPEPLLFYLFVGNVRLQAFFQSYSSERKVLLRYGPKLIGYSNTIKLWFRSHIKSAALPLLCSFNRQDFVTRLAYKPIDAEQAQKAREVLQYIRQTDVPGW